METSLTIINPPLTERNPWVIRRITERHQPYDHVTERYQGELARVRPANGADVALIKMLRHGIDYFAPVSGNGLLVKPELLKR